MPPSPPWNPATIALAHGYDPAEASGAAKPPIYMSSTFCYPSARHAKDLHRSFFDHVPFEHGDPGYIYARLGHPGLKALEARLAALDGAEASAAFNSGMAAITAILVGLTRPGDGILHSRPIYGGSDALIHGELARLGVRATGIPDGVDPARVRGAAEEAMAAGPVSVIWIETPANPTSGIVDIALMAQVAAEIGARQGGRRPVLAVDNTFLGPLLQSPLAFGADLVMTSLTKYSGGHSDLLAGGVSGTRAGVDRLEQVRTLFGSHLDPFNAWLLTRSMETMALRTERAGSNAALIAHYLQAHPKVAGLTYLGLVPAGTPERAVFERQCRGAGSTFSFSIHGGEAEAFAMLDRLRLFKMAVSLGGTESLICHSASTTHCAVDPAQRLAMGIGEGTMRVSVGIEHPDDLIADLGQALEAS